MRKQLLGKIRLSRSAVKESIDNLPMGLCFADQRGLLILINRSMIRLSHSITGKDLQDAEVFWQTVTEGALKDGIERIPYGASTVLRLPQGGVWAFSRSSVSLDGKPVTQIVASDITELDAARVRLNAANEKLQYMNDRLKQYGKDIVEVTAQEERLATKVRIHDEFGSVLLATRHYLLENEGEEAAAPILELWRRDISVLRGSAETQPQTPMASITKAAKALGIVLHVEGEVPKERKAETLLLTAVSEALNNAARHAAAKNLTVSLTKSEERITAHITNDGTLPEGEISEGGGLTALRRSLELCGGTLKISIAPVYKMTVTIPNFPEGQAYND